MLGLVVVLGWLSLGHPGTAAAFTAEAPITTEPAFTPAGSYYSYTGDTAMWDTLKMNWGDTAVSTNLATQAEALPAGGVGDMLAAESATGLLSGLPPIMVGVGGFTAGWYLGNQIDGYLGITGSTDNGTADTSSGYSQIWQWYNGGDHLTGGGSYVVPAGGAYYASWTTDTSNPHANPMGLLTIASTDADPVAAAKLAALPGTTVSVTGQSCPTYHYPFSGTTCVTKMTDAGQALAGLSVGSITSQASGGTANWTAPSITSPPTSSAGLAAARAYLSNESHTDPARHLVDLVLAPSWTPGVTIPSFTPGEDCSTYRTAILAAGAVSVTCVATTTPDYTKAPNEVITVSPGGGSTLTVPTTPVTITANPATVTVPAPASGEIGSAYTGDLHTAGLAESTTTLTTADSRFGPNQVVSVSPAVGSSVATGSTVDVSVNPSTAPSPSGVVAPPGPGGCSPWVVPSLDLSPLRVAIGTVFPFGILVWTYNALGMWSATPVAPAFDFPMPSVVGDIHIDFAVLEPMMEVIRPVIVIGSLLLLVWWLAGAVLGFGNNGGGADE